METVCPSPLYLWLYFGKENAKENGNLARVLGTHEDWCVPLLILAYSRTSYLYIYLIGNVGDHSNNKWVI